MKERKDLMTSAEAANYLWGATGSDHVGTLNNWRALFAGPDYIKLGNLVRYSREDLDAFIKERTVRNVQDRDRVQTMPVPKMRKLPMPMEMRTEKQRIRRKKVATS